MLIGIVNNELGLAFMRWLKIFTSSLLFFGVSGFDLDHEADFYPSRNVAFEKCEEWKDKGNVVVYKTNINIAEEASQFTVEHPVPISASSDSIYSKLKYANRLYEWNKAVQKFLVSHPTKLIKVNSRICDYEPKAKLFFGYENKLIQEGAWKDEDGKRGQMIKVKSFRY